MSRRLIADFVAAMAMAVVSPWIPSRSVAQEAAGHGTVYVIGDSSVDAGNFNLSPPLPKKDRPYYFRGRYSDSYIWSDLVTMALTGHYSYASGPFTAPYLAKGRTFVPQGTNYAYGGAVTGEGPDLAPPPVPSMREQVSALVSANPHLDAQSLFLLSGGGNDFIANAALPRRQQLSAERVADRAAATIAQLVRDLAAVGGRHFLVNVSSEDSIAPQPGRFREKLSAELDRLGELFPDVQIVKFDSSKVFERVALHASDYHISDPVRSCFIFDLAAPTFKAYTYDPAQPPPPGSIRPKYPRAGVCRDVTQHLLVDGLHDTSPVQAALAHAALEALGGAAPGSVR